MEKRISTKKRGSITILFAVIYLMLGSSVAFSQDLKALIDNQATSVKNQGQSGTCWDFSTTSLIESENLRKGIGEMDLSEMFIARCVYLEKAKNYVSRQGKAQFGEGGLGHDVLNAITKYGAMPQDAFPGYTGQIPDHRGLEKSLKGYLDSVLAKLPLAADWVRGYEQLLDARFGTPPASFNYLGKTYTPIAFAQQVLKFDANDYVSLTSFTDQPYYRPFILNIPDNWANGSFYNIQLNELISVSERVLKEGYTLMWDADVSNGDFQAAVSKGFAHLTDTVYNATVRQQLFENLTTQDDHLMHITGLSKDTQGAIYFKVKNSWGPVGPFNGYVEVSIPYFAINTIGLVVPKKALPKALKRKLGV